MRTKVDKVNKKNGTAGGMIHKKTHAGDFWLLLLVMILLTFGIIMVFSASYYYSISKTGQPYSYLIKDVVWVIIGIFCMVFAATIPYNKYAKFAKPLMLLSLLLLGLVFTPLGVTRNLATRWVGVSLGSHEFTIMPGEIAKIAAIIFTAWYLSEKPQRIRTLKGILPLLGLAICYFAMIIKQPNLSTALTVVGIIMGIMFVAGISWRYIGIMPVLGTIGTAALIFIDKDGYRLKRVMSFKDPFQDKLGDGWQVVHSLFGLGSGGFLGLGLGKSIQKNLWLPEPQNDFIFAVIGEELGFIGSIMLIAVYMLLIWRGAYIAINARDMFSSLMASGITIMIGLQVIMNIAVVTSSMPCTGITLPFISYGGNALIMFMISTGILLNISRYTNKNASLNKE